MVSHKEESAMTTYVQYKGIECSKKRHYFWTNFGTHIVLKSFKDGIADIYIPGEKCTSCIEIIVGCFDSKSNFKEEICKALNSNSAVKGIHISLDDVNILVTDKNADVKKVIREFFSILDKRDKKYASGNARRILELDETIEMMFKNDKTEKEWEEWVDLSLGSYSVKFARRWAKYMQFTIAEKGTTVTECARETLEEFDVSRFLGRHAFGTVISVLGRCWKYGDELLKWYDEGMK